MLGFLRGLGSLLACGIGRGLHTDYATALRLGAGHDKQSQQAVALYNNQLARIQSAKAM